VAGAMGYALLRESSATTAPLEMEKAS